MKGWAVPLLILALAAAAAALALRPPAPLPANAPRGFFSAGRAMADVRILGQGPHPMGSPRQAQVQAYLLARMASLGLQPQARPFASPKGPGTNLLGILPGRDRAAPAVLLAAHTDSVAQGPGAADDGAGVASVLEAVRVLSLQPRQRDVMVLLTDGEELGSLGAHAFFTADPARSHVGIMINLEARGDRGRAVMFETHRDAEPLIAALNGAKALAGASSLMPDLYRRLPNGADLTQAITRGWQGLNYAFFSGFDAYHTALDTPARLDPGSLQHIGQQALGAAAALASTGGPLPARAADRPYADILGGPVIQYPVWVGWLLLLLGAGGAAAYALRLAQADRLTLIGVIAGAAAFLGLVLAIALALYGLGRLRIELDGHRLAPLLRHEPAAMAGAALLAIGVALVWLTAAERRLRSQSLAFGALLVLALGAVALQALAPLDAFVLIWPFLLIGLALAIGGPTRPWAEWVILLAAAAQVLYWAGLYFDLVGQVTPFETTPFAALAAAIVLSTCPHSGRGGLTAGAVAAAAGVGLSLWSLAP